MTRFLRSKDDGFTLIELLIVIAILAILVSIVSISMTGVMDQVTTVSASVETRSVQLAIDSYNAFDVTAGGAAEIVAGGPAHITTSSPVFGKYLSGTTHNCYTWLAKGASLTQAACP